jgi:hypothetical protein
MRIRESLIYLIVAASLAPSLVHAGSCRVQLANYAPHSSTAQKVMSSLEAGITSSQHLALAEQAFDLEFHLIDAHIDSAGYPGSERLRVFYVLTGPSGRFISASVLTCPTDAASCVIPAEFRLLEGCKLHA